MNEAEFLKRWRDERPEYEAWGEFVSKEIVDLVKTANPGLDIEIFLKVPCKWRTKTEDSLVGKAFHHRKSYTNPYEQIEDKVGVRYVVLLTTDIAKLQAAIELSDAWEASLDKHPDKDRENRPQEFAYQSVHFVLRSKGVRRINDIDVRENTPCEVQLRTLLQHAHSELTHDNVYKREAQGEVSHRVHRTIAKSMALIEVVDDHFKLAVDELEAATAAERQAMEILWQVFRTRIGRTPNHDRSTSIVLQAFPEELTTDLLARLNAFLDAYPFVPESIGRRFDHSYTFRQPWVLLAYLMARSRVQVQQTSRRWPLELVEVEPVFADMGFATS